MNFAELQRIAHGAMLERNLRPQFSAQALQQAQGLSAASADTRGTVQDLRHLPWCSIDNDDSRDLDQLTVADVLPGGVAVVSVAVADVDAFVSPGSAIDEHAAHNTTSVYTPAGVFNMLPERLSNDLSSLNEGEERLALVMRMTVQPDGGVSNGELLRAAVFNHARLAYNGVADWLDGRGELPAALRTRADLQQQLRLQDQIAQRLQRWRRERGALELQTSEARPVFVNGELVDLRPDERNRAKELIGELMIAANAATARFLQQRGSPSLRRFLREPARWDRLQQLALQLGEALPAQPDAVALDRLLRRRQQADPQGFADLSLAVVKLLGAGEYSAAAPGEARDGHFGLAVHDYAHATAPNRRFADLLTHRLVKAALLGEGTPYTVATLQAAAAQCNLQARNANKVERQVRKAAAALLLAPRVGQRFHGLVTGVKPSATYVRITSPTAEGRIVHGFEGLDVGDRVSVRLVAVDAGRGYIDFERA